MVITWKDDLKDNMDILINEYETKGIDLYDEENNTLFDTEFAKLKKDKLCHIASLWEEIKDTADTSLRAKFKKKWKAFENLETGSFY